MPKLLHLFAAMLLALNTVTANTGYVYINKETKLYYVKDNEVYSANNGLLQYFQKGNIFFSSSDDDRQHIYIMATSLDIYSKNRQLLYEKDNSAPTYSFADGKLYVGRPESEDLMESNELLHVQKSGKWTAFYSSINDSLLAYYETDSVSANHNIIIAYALVGRYGLQARVVQQQNKAPFADGAYAYLKPMWGNVTANEWLWDGKILRPRWNVDPRLAWTFDGQTLKQQYVSNIYEQYSWDGEYFKPTWRTVRTMEWSWDGRIMKPTWDTDWANQYIIEGGVVKPWSNVHTDKEWRLDGDIPVPVIIAVISGIVHP